MEEGRGVEEVVLELGGVLQGDARAGGHPGEEGLGAGVQGGELDRLGLPGPGQGGARETRFQASRIVTALTQTDFSLFPKYAGQFLLPCRLILERDNIHF